MCPDVEKKILSWEMLKEESDSNNHYILMELTDKQDQKRKYRTKGPSNATYFIRKLAQPSKKATHRRKKKLEN